MMLELTYRCNFKCKHCYIPGSYKKKFRQELNTKQIFSILDQLQELGCLYLGLTGGEPFLREDIFKILGYAKKKGFQIIIYTNGSLIDEDKAQRLQRLSPNKVDITIPAVSKDIFERITGLKGSREKVFEAISILHRNGVRLGVKSCMLKGNENEINGIQDFAASLGIPYRLDTMLSRCLDGSDEPFGYRAEIERVTSAPVPPKADPPTAGLQCSRKTPPGECGVTDNGELFKCGVGKSQAAITPYGELKMCLMIDYPGYKILNRGVPSARCPVPSTQYPVSSNPASQSPSKKDGLEKAWGKLKGLVAGIKPDKNYQCDKCAVSQYCRWCPATAWLYNKSFTSCVPETLNRAEQGKRGYEYRG